MIITDSHTILSVESTYLDSWFSALITGIKAVSAGNMVTVEVAEEPYPLIFGPWKSGMILSYKDRALQVKQID